MRIVKCSLLMGAQVPEIGDFYYTHGVTLTLEDGTLLVLDYRVMGLIPMIQKLRQLTGMRNRESVGQMMDAIVGKDWIDD